MIIRTISLFILTALVSVATAAQESYTPLATMNGRNFTVQDLPTGQANAWSKLPETLSKARKDLLEMQINNILLHQEAAKQSVEIEALVAKEVDQKVKEPTDAQMIAFFEANKANLGDATFDKMRPQIANYLSQEAKSKAMSEYVASLRAKAKIENVKDINASRLVPADTIVSINDEPITVARFNRKNGLPIYEYEANVFDQVNGALKLIVDAAVYQAESQSLNIRVNQLIQNEITSKMKDFSNAEQDELETALRSRLYSKYRVKIFIEKPQPFLQRISLDDDPVIGKQTAKVAVVIFADYECPACAAINPIIKEVAAKYGDNVKLVFRDFPLTGIHKNALGAAHAAFAARKQDKYFEYSEMLYENQEALDRESLLKYAKGLGMNIEQFTVDMDSDEAAEEIRKDISEGEDYGVAGTPSIFVNGYKIRSLSVKAFDDAIKEAIDRKY